jgi:hypothetical protein
VTFGASAAAQPYCEAVASQRNGQQAAGLDPAAVRSYVTSGTLSENLDTQDATAPAEIVADAKAVNEWTRTREREVLEEFDYDFRRILLEGSAQDVAAFTYWDPAIVEHDTRVTAFQVQVCGGLTRVDDPQLDHSRIRLPMCAATTGAITARETARSGTRGTKAQNAKAATGIATNTRLVVDDGSASGATTATASAKTATKRRSSSARDVASSDSPATSRLYCAALASTSSSGPSPRLRLQMDPAGSDVGARS